MKRVTGATGWWYGGAWAGVALLVSACAPAQPSPGIPAGAAQASRGDSGAPFVSLDAGSDAGGFSEASQGDGGDQQVHEACHAVRCIDGAGISVVLPVPASVLANARVFISVGPENLEVRRPRPVDSYADSYAWRPPLLSVGQRVISLSSGASQLDLGINIPSELAVDGVAYSVRIENARGRPLLNVSRTMLVAEAPHGPGQCRPFCKLVSMRLYSGSRSGVTCGSIVCESGLELRLNAPSVIAQIEGGSVEVCRNQVCSVAQIEALPKAVDWHGYDTRFRIPLPFLDSYVAYNFRTLEQLTIRALSDPTMLADGDRYTVTFRKGSQVIGRFERQVRYESSFPNGEACDTLPCRRAVIDASL